MSLQTIINIAESITINRRRVVGLQYTRNEIARISETPTRNPWRMTVTVSALIPYAQGRQLIEELDRLDRSIAQTVTFSNNPKLSFMFKYQGDFPTNIATMTVQSASGKQVVLTNLFIVDPTDVVFYAGDIIQFAGYPYPFTVTQTVQRGTGNTVTLTLHRPIFLDTGDLVGSNIVAGNSVSFRMICANMPTYTIVPGPYIQFNGDFELYESTGAIV